MYPSITVKAGARALQILRDEGLAPGRVRVLAGASGGPKWLVLAGMDRVLPDFIGKRKDPLFLIGSSIGSWRMAALAQRNPVTAVETFEEAYISQSYSAKPDIHEVTRELYRVMDNYLDGDSIDHILSHPFMRSNIVAVRSLSMGKSDIALIQLAFLSAAALSNLISRRLLKCYYRRALFFDSREESPFIGMNDFPIDRAPLTRENFRKVLQASGSIPLVMEGVREISGAPAGVYRDGGIIDYHLDIPFNVGPEEIVLYPHFFGHIVPGWFDKALKRRPSSANMENVVLVAPSDEFVKSLPIGKIPDRKDFKLFLGRDDERVRYWKEVASRSRRIGEEFMEAVLSGHIGKIVVPLETR